MSVKRVPFTQFGKTRLVPLRVFVDCKLSTQEWFQDSLWVERGEDWYGLRKHPTLVVEREEWLKSPDYEQ